MQYLGPMATFEENKSLNSSMEMGSEATRSFQCICDTCKPKSFGIVSQTVISVQGCCLFHQRIKKTLVMSVL